MFTPPFILSIAGGGSTYTPGIVKSLMVRLQDFPLAEIRLYDIDEARQNTIAPVVEKVIRDHSQSIKFTVTNDPEVAFSGAHFVFAQMRVGQYKMREQDEKIPLRHGVVWSGDLRPRRAGLWAAYDPANGRAYRSGGSLRA
ncbi:glycoside hydrolase family protein [Enterobacter cloacae]|uniref:Glycoside hydrolase family protein n=1 Tax=Enterobacter cloacae TaxID=550 RepID=A0A377LV20_ENTCL|nr:glycoside hydrolase family protein [Enterobacter cloacae]